MIALRYVYVLSLVIWLGGTITIAGVVAPAVFAALEGSETGGRQAAGRVVGEVLRRFQPVSYLAGVSLLLTLLAMKVVGPRPQGFGIRLAVVSTMLAASVVSGLLVTPQIAAIRDEVGAPMDTLAPTDARRARFGQLHGLSTALMAVTVIGGLVLCYWETRE